LGGEPGEELLGDLVEGGELRLAEHVVRRAAQRVFVAQDRVAQLGRRRVQCDGSAGRGLRAVAPEDAGQDVLGGCGVHAGDAGSLSGSAAASARRIWFSDRPRVRATLSGLGAGQDHVRRLDRESLRRADAGRVPEPDVIRDVGRGQHDAATQPPPGWGDSEAAVPADVSDAPTILVLDPVGVADHQSAVVVPGEDDVAGADVGGVGQHNFAGGTAGGGEAVSACALVQLGHQLAGRPTSRASRPS
jgi:hypothetical protein